MSTPIARPTLLYATLMPESPGKRREDHNITQLISRWAAAFEPQYDLKILIGSAHPSALDTIAALLRPWRDRLELIHCPFVPDDRHDERRAHEIAFGKQHLASCWQSRAFDSLFYLDADIAIDFDAVDQLIRAIDDPMTFINIPYAIHTQHQAPDQQLGAFIHTRQLLDQLPYAQAIYQTHEQQDRIHRQDAPDCAIRSHLLAGGAKELRAKPPRFAVTTRHYRHAHTYSRYQAGRITTHADMTALLGFDPLLDGMAMEPESCLAIQNWCRSRNIQRVLNLGTGSGNSLLAAAMAGASVLSIDERDSFTQLGNHLAREHGLDSRIDCRTAKLDPAWHHAYDLQDLASQTFGLTIVDGPAQNPPGRVASLRNIKSKSFLFHDADRDHASHQTLLNQWRAAGLTVSASHFNLGRKLLLLEIEGAGASDVH